MRQQGDRVELFYNRWREGKAALIGLFFLAGGVWLLFAPLRPDFQRTCAAYCAMVLGCFGVGIYVPRFLRRKPVLSFDARGFTVQEGKHDRFLAWKDVEKLYSTIIGNRLKLVFRPADPAAHLRTLPAHVQKNPGMQAVFCQLPDTEMKLEDLEAAMTTLWFQHRHEHLDSNHPPIFSEYPRPGSGSSSR